MKRIQIRLLLIPSLLTLLLLIPGLIPDIAAEPGRAAPAVQGATISRIGIFDSRLVAFAYGNSELNLERVRELKMKRQQAVADGDDETKAECELLGPRWQELLHRQVFGDAPITDILTLLKPQLDELRRLNDIDLIVTGIVTTSDGVEIVDVTHEMMTLFGLDEKAIERANELKNHPPIPWYEFPLKGE